MARPARAAKGTKRGAKAPPETAPGTEIVSGPKPVRVSRMPLPSPLAGTNLVIADVVLRAAGGLLRDRMEKGLLTASYDKAKADKLIESRSLVTSMALWGASHLARRSPLGLAVVVGGLAAKVLYDRGKRLDGTKARVRRKGKEAGTSPTDKT